MASQEIDGDEDEGDYDGTGVSRLVLVGEQKRKRKFGSRVFLSIDGMVEHCGTVSSSVLDVMDRVVSR